MRDAQRLRDILIEQYTFDEKRTKLLANPTRSEIIDAFDITLGLAAASEDHVLIFYAGHGHWDEDARQGYWLPADARHNSRANWISNSDIRDLIRGVKNKHTLLISDACFSGGIFKERKAFANSGAVLDKITMYPSRKAMTSGTLKTVPDESVFVDFLFRRLESNEDRWLSASQLFASIEEGVMANVDNKPQFGTIHGAGDEGGDFVFVRREVKDDGSEASQVPDSFSGTLALFASHPGAVKVDGVAVGTVEPGRIKQFIVSPGTHFVQVEATHCVPWLQKVDVQSGENTAVEVILEEIETDQPSVKSNTLGMEFVRIMPGTFVMGSNGSVKNEAPAHHVEITRMFYMSKYPVTQAQWEAVMGTNPSLYNVGENHPVEKVSWRQVQQFVAVLNKEDESYRLPTEAEWEYACRAGSASKYFFGDEPGDLGRYAVVDNHDHHAPVGTREPNPWGLYDMLGNVWEWVEDWYSETYYSESPLRDPAGPPTGKDRVMRGGAFDYEAEFCRSATRFGDAPGYHGENVGFRLVWVI